MNPVLLAEFGDHELPNPFGTFKKTKYEICAYDITCYTCVTTCRSEDDIIRHLYEKISCGYYAVCSSIRITKTVKGKKEELFRGTIRNLKEKINSMENG